MSVNAETNVRIAPCTLDALRRIMVRRGTSRDEAVRQLLAEHVTRLSTFSSVVVVALVWVIGA